MAKDELPQSEHICAVNDKSRPRDGGFCLFEDSGKWPCQRR